MLKIPFQPYPCFSEDLVIEGVPYTFEFTWNSRGEFWTLAIYNSGRSLIVAGIKLVLGFDLLRDRKHLAVPSGGLYVLDASGGTGRIAYEDFTTGTRGLKLYYLTEEENAAIQ